MWHVCHLLFGQCTLQTVLCFAQRVLRWAACTYLTPQPNAITARGLIPPGMMSMQPQALAPLSPLPADPMMTSVQPNQSIMHDASQPSQAPVQQHPSSLQPFPPVPADPNMTGCTQVSMQEPPVSAQVPDTEPAEPQRLTWLHIDAAKQTAP